MLSGKYIFAQLIEFLPQKYFQRLVMKYEGEIRKTFQLLESVACYDVRSVV
jgi:hypothetical protein